MSVKSLKNFSNAKLNDPHGFKEELKIKYDTVLDVVGKFPNRICSMMELLKAEKPALDWAAYYTMDIADQAMWEERDDASTKAILLLLNSKNNNTKKDLRPSYSQGNKSAYLITAKAMAKYLSTQYPNKTIDRQHNKKGDTNGKKGDDSKPEDKDKDKDNNTTKQVIVQVHSLIIFVQAKKYGTMNTIVNQKDTADGILSCIVNCK